MVHVGLIQAYSRHLTGLAMNIQVLQSFSASHDPFPFTLRSMSTQTIDKYPSKHANCFLSQCFLPIFADVAIIAIGSYAKMGGVS